MRPTAKPPATSVTGGFVHICGQRLWMGYSGPSRAERIQSRTGASALRFSSTR